MGHIGDVDLEFVVAIFEWADVDGIVKIAGSFTVDGDDRKLAVVASAAHGFGGNFGRDGLRFFDYFGREAVRQVELADHDFDVDAEVGLFAENFDDASAGALGGTWPFGNFYVDYYAFEILPVGVDGSLVAYDPIVRSFPL